MQPFNVIFINIRRKIKMEEKRMKKVSLILTIIIAIVAVIIIGFIIRDLTKSPYSNPKIPDGFYYVMGEWNTGFVISDSNLDENNPEGNNGNQFVWIPIKDTKKFKRTASFGDEIVDLNPSYIEPSANDINYDKMIKSVEKYGGFYIGRYETGDADVTEHRTNATETHNAVVKKNQFVYNYVMWGNGEGGAVNISTAMYEDSSSVNSTLVYGIQWDAVMNFIKEDVDLNNSNQWGNYKDSLGYAAQNCGTLQKTGANEYWKAKNIYDLAGNVGEWTMESNLEKIKIIRGGAYNNNGSSEGYPVAGRYDNYPTNTNSNVGFRVALYLK